MKRITLILLGLLLTADFIFAGGLVTNTNQSTAWTRMLVRDATTEIDAVFYNPAGLVKLQDGFHISLSNQSIFQTQTITTTFPVNNREYVGDISAPLFPSIYLVYKTGRWALSTRGCICVPTPFACSAPAAACAATCAFVSINLPCLQNREVGIFVGF